MGTQALGGSLWLSGLGRPENGLDSDRNNLSIDPKPSAEVGVDALTKRCIF